MVTSIDVESKCLGFNISWLDDKEQFIHLSIPFFLLGGAVERIHLPMQEMQDMKVWSLGREDNLEKGMATHSGIRA